MAGQVFPETFSTKELAERFRGDLRKAARNGEDFDEVTGLPESMERKRSQVTFYQHCLDFTAVAWPSAAAKSRMIIIDALARAVSVAVREVRCQPEQETLRRALTVALNPSDRVRDLDRDEARAIAWVAKASRSLRDLEKPDVTSGILQAPGHQTRRETCRSVLLRPPPPAAAPGSRCRRPPEAAKRQPAGPGPGERIMDSSR